MKRDWSPGNPLPLWDRFWSHVDPNGPVPEACPELGQCWLWAVPGGGSHWKVYRGEAWLGWVHRFGRSGRPWRAKPADGLPLAEHFARRRDGVVTNSYRAARVYLREP